MVTDEAPESLAAVLGVPPLWGRLLHAWGIDGEPAYLALLQTDCLSDPDDLLDLTRAASLLADAVRARQRIRVHGDYDADGVTATAILVRALSMLGADVDHFIPNRFDDGYGLSVEAVERAREENISLLVTVDCGSSAVEAARAARRIGLGLIVTDHHRIPEEWPNVEAFVNPERSGPDHPILCGAGVALQLARALLGGDPPPALWGLAALGTVADVMPMRGDSRVIVRRGLAALRRGLPVGLAALQRTARRDVAHASARDLGFALAPRINAAGRLGSPGPALGLALTDSEAEAESLARELEALNQRRRALGEEVYAAARAAVAQRQGPLPPFLVVAGERFHEGVIGIAAGRLSELYGRPTAVVAIGPEGHKGSARGGRFGDVFAALDSHRELFSTLGGHRGAAGFTVRPEALAGLEAALSSSLVVDADPGTLGPVVDVEPEELTPGLGAWLDSLEPFGPGLEAPKFRVAGEVEQVRRMGHDGSHARFTIHGAPLETVAFAAGPTVATLAGRKAVLLVTLESSWWRGRQRYELRLDSLLWPPASGPGTLTRHRWELADPVPSPATLVVAASHRRARAAAASGQPLLSWWQDFRPAGPLPDARALGRVDTVHVLDGPPHRWALEALLAALPAHVVVHWRPAALDPQPVLRRWQRLVPDADRLRALWRRRRDGLAPLCAGRRVLVDLGLWEGGRPDRRRELQESVHFRTAWVERRAAEQDWSQGGPWAWREEEVARGLAE